MIYLLTIEDIFREMSNNISKMPKSIEKLMKIYSKYEDEYKNGDKGLDESVDKLQNYAYSENPITPTHMDYYHSRYKKGHNEINFIWTRNNFSK